MTEVYVLLRLRFSGLLLKCSVHCLRSQVLSLCHDRSYVHLSVWLRGLHIRHNQLHRLPRFPEHLEQHLGLGLEQGDPVLQIGGMTL